MKYYAAHNGVAAVYDKRGDAVPFETAAEARKHGDVVTKRPHNYYWAERMSSTLYITAWDRHGRVIYRNHRER